MPNHVLTTGQGIQSSVKSASGNYWHTQKWQQKWQPFLRFTHVRGRRRLTGVLSSCLRNMAASSRPSYSAWVWSRFLKTFYNQQEDVNRFIVWHSLIRWYFWERWNVNNINRQRDMPSQELGEDMTHAESQMLLPLFTVWGLLSLKKSKCVAVCEIQTAH